MQRTFSDMTPRQLERWRKRHDFSLTDCAERLGIARSSFAKMLNGQSRIPKTIALLCEAIDYIKSLEG